MAITVTQTPNSVLSTLNRIVVRATADPAWDTHDSYYIRLVANVELEFEGGNFLTIPLDQVPDPTDGDCVFNLSHLFHAYVQPDRPEDVITDTPIVLSKMVRNAGYSLQEYIDGQAQGTPIPGPALNIYRSAFDYVTGQELQAFAISAGKFLTHAPNPKEVRTNQPEFLTLIAPTGTTSVQLNWEVTFDDDTTQSGTTPAISCNAFNPILFPTGFNQLRLDLISGTIVSWRVWIEDQSNTTISIIRVYTLNNAPCSQLIRYYLFENSLGGWDTLCTYGEGQTEMSVSKRESQFVPDPMGDPTDPVFRAYGRKFRNQYQQATGWMTLGEIEWARDILLSEVVFRIGDYYPKPTITTADYLWPVIVSPGNTLIHSDSEFMKAFEFTAVDAFENRGIHPTLIEKIK